MRQLKSAINCIASWRACGDKIGFTNGCFDLLHLGHRQLLERSRRLCDRLVVGLNDDNSVRHLKGSGRPFEDEISRAASLAALDCVDLVILFSEDTPLDLIAEVRPDVLTKGADYSLGQVVGAAIAGEVVLIDLKSGYGTTENSVLEKTVRNSLTIRKGNLL